MLILDQTTSKLQVLMDATAATTESPVLASYDDITTTTFTPTAPGSAVTITTGTTAVDLIAAPASSTQRVVKFLTIQNADSVSRTATFRYNYNGTTRTIFKATLAVGDHAIYCNGEWKVIDQTGNTKVIFSVPSVSQGGTGATTLGSSKNPVLGNGTGALTAMAAPTTTDSNADAQAGTSATTKKALVLQASASQTATIQEWQKSDGTLQSCVTPAGWFQSTVGRKRVTAQFDKANTTLAAITGLSWNVEAGRSYNFLIVLHCTLDGTSGGKWDLNGGSATMTTFNSHYCCFGTSVVNTSTHQTAMSTSYSVANANTTTGVKFEISGTMTVNAAGTFIPQFALNSGTTTGSVLVGSFGWLEDCA